MNGNIVEMLKQQLAPQLAQRAAQMLGVSPESALTMVQGAISAILATFLHVGSTPAGASALSSAAERAARADGGDQPGTGLLGSLLGEGKMSSLTGALSNFAGVNSNQASSLLGMAAPMVLGFLGRQPSVAGQGPQGLMNLLSGQKNAILSALPPDLSNRLGSSGLLAGLGQTGRDAVAGTANVTQAAANRAGTVPRATPWTAPRRSWLRPAMGVLAAIVLIGVIWQVMSGSRTQQATEQPTNQTTAATQQPAGAAPPAAGAAQPATQTAMTVGDVDLAKSISGSLSQINQTLGGITDVDTAKAAVPHLQSIADDVNKVKGLAGQLPSSGRGTLAGLVKQAMPEVQAAVDKVYAIPGTTDVLKPAVDPLLGTLGDLQREPA